MVIFRHLLVQHVFKYGFLKSSFICHTIKLLKYLLQTSHFLQVTSVTMTWILSPVSSMMQSQEFNQNMHKKKKKKHTHKNVHLGIPFLAYPTITVITKMFLGAF